MSYDTGDETVSMVVSSLTEWKNDMGNLDCPEIPGNEVKEYSCHMEVEQLGYSSEQLQTTSEIIKAKPCKTRYFIIKSLNHQNLQLSIKRGIWATQVMNEPILEEAFHNSGKVILIFSVNMSGSFQGYAQMLSPIDGRRNDVWSQSSGGNNPWGRSFKVKWLQLHDLPFQETLHLKNPLNQYKPVKISRDCQELPQDIGQSLCDLLDGKNDIDVGLKRGEFARDDLYLRRPTMEPSGALRVEDFAPPMHMTPTFYPSLLYPQLAEANGFHIGPQRSTGGSLCNKKTDRDASSRCNVWGLSAERSSLTSSITEDDILGMTYEEYLDAAQNRCTKKYYKAPSAQSSSTQCATNEAPPNASQSRSRVKKRCRQPSPRSSLP